MFEHRLSKFGRTILLVACLLFVGGMQQSCKDWLDDYKYDDSEPEWLGASIYAFLQEGTPNHSYKNYVELIDSLGERNTLEKTGSKTLFVADDAAFARFYANNPWGVKSVADMTKAQRKYLFYNTMLANAVLLDMMPNTSADSEGDCLVRETDFDQLDSVPRIHSDYYPLHSSWPTYNQYWDMFADRQDTLSIAMSSSSIVHIFDSYLKRNSVQVKDVNFVFEKAKGKNYKEGDVFLYGNKLVDAEMNAGTFSEDPYTVSCKNGYVYRMDEVLLTPMDMASELRVREDARIFSHLLDRFCIPVPDAGLTQEYEALYKKQVGKDSIYTLKYFTKDYNGGALFDKLEMSNPADDERLRYDPSAQKSNKDIYAMLVPKDEYMYDYFSNGNGQFLLDRFAPSVVVEPNFSADGVDKLLEALDSIPQVSIATFLNNLMQESFTSTVPSKFERITDDANDDLGVTEDDVDECLIANNGVIYILNKVFSPAQFSSVAGPVDINENMRIMKQFIKELQYNFYLLAMDANYSLIIPDDNHFVYYDPTSFGTYSVDGRMEMYSLQYDSNQGFWYKIYEVDETNKKIQKLIKDVKNDGKVDDKSKRILTDILEYLIVVHNSMDDSEDSKIHPEKMYYSTKGNGTIKIDATDPDNIKFYGGEQLENNTEIVASNIIAQENGTTYCTVPVNESTEDMLYSSIPTPPTKSIYDNMSAHAANKGDIYYEFYQLCKANGLKDLLDKIYAKSEDYEAGSVAANDTLKLYSIFYSELVSNNGDDLDKKKMDNVVPFLNTYHYTVYIPSNESIKDLYNQGLPTWDMISSEASKNPQRAMSLIRLVNNFIRYHFQDQSVYHDRSPFYVYDAENRKQYEVSLATSLINNSTGRFYELKLKSDDSNSTILIQDEWAKNNSVEDAKILTTPSEENKTWNVMCRDRVGYKEISSSSYAVIQPIDRALLNSSFFGYDGDFVRFATNGCRVDTMYVTGGKDGHLGENCYLVANAGRVPRSTSEVSQPKELENVEIAYLMQEINSTHVDWDNKLAHETLVRDAEGKPILITRDGYRVIKTVTEEGYDTYRYYTEIKDGKEYRMKLNNLGEPIQGTEVEIASADANK